jgi:hypothetical protein
VGSWTLGPFAGTQTLRASAPTTSASDLDITATATTGLAAAINPHPDNPTSALVRSEIVIGVIVVDDLGNPRAGIAVNFAPLTSHFGQGTILSQSQNVMTNAQGVASVRYMMPDNAYAAGGIYASSSGVNTLQVNVSPMTGPPSEIRVTLPSDPVVAGGELGRQLAGLEGAIAFDLLPALLEGVEAQELVARGLEQHAVIATLELGLLLE